MSSIVSLLMLLLGGLLPLLSSALIPDGSQRWAAAVFALIGCGVFINFMGGGLSIPSFGIGLGLGFLFATAKLAFGIRFL